MDFCSLTQKHIMFDDKWQSEAPRNNVGLTVEQYDLQWDPSDQAQWE